MCLSSNKKKQKKKNKKKKKKQTKKNIQRINTRLTTGSLIDLISIKLFQFIVWLIGVKVSISISLLR